MSKFIFPPQIQQLRAANAGQISLADVGVKMIGVSKFVVAAQFVGQSIVLALVSALGTALITANQTPTIMRAFLTTIGVQANNSSVLSMISALGSSSTTADTTPTIGVATFTQCPYP
jgi:hypothetical protein